MHAWWWLLRHMRATPLVKPKRYVIFWGVIIVTIVTVP